MNKSEGVLFYALAVHPLQRDSLNQELEKLGIRLFGVSTVFSGDAASSEYRVHVFITEENLSYLKLKMPDITMSKLYQ